MEKFLILGGGSKLAKCFLQLYPNISIPISKNKCDITNLKEIEDTVIKKNSKYVLNCAAITDIEYCENNREKCLRVNAYAVKNLETLCQKYGKKLIHISSDYAVKPKNIYGYSKYLSEKILDKNKTLIIRTSFYHKDLYIIKAILKDRNVEAYRNMYFNPVSINKVAKIIYQYRNKNGTINVFSSKKISKHNFALKVCEVFKKDKNLINPVNFVNKKGFAERPLNSFVKSDVDVNLDKDLSGFKKFLANRS